MVTAKNPKQIAANASVSVYLFVFFFFLIFLILSFSSLFLLNLPFADGSLGAVKADTHFYQSLTLRMIWQHVALFIYLSQSLIGTLINLQFEDIYRIWHVHHGISSADGTLHLCPDINIQETEHQIEDGLIMHRCRNGEDSHNEESTN